MPPSNDSGSANLGTVIPSAWETALNDLRKQRFLNSDRDNPPSKSQTLKEATELYLAVLKAQNALPSEALDDVQGLDANSVLEDYGLSISSDLSRIEAVEEIAAQEVDVQP